MNSNHPDGNADSAAKITPPGRASRLPPLPRPPAVPDYNAIAQASEAKADAEVQAAEAKVARMRAGVWTPDAQAHQSKSSADAGFEVRMDWRGESAYYAEPGRQVWLFASYWGSGTGNLEHINAVWEYADGRREKLTDDERLEILRRVIRHIHAHEHLEVTAKELAGETTIMNSPHRQNSPAARPQKNSRPRPAAPAPNYASINQALENHLDLAWTKANQEAIRARIGTVEFEKIEEIIAFTSNQDAWLQDGSISAAADKVAGKLSQNYPLLSPPAIFKIINQAAYGWR